VVWAALQKSRISSVPFRFMVEQIGGQPMTPSALYSGARQAMRMAREAQREDDLLEALRHKERAREYLRSRRMTLMAIATMEKSTSKENARVFT
jgi:hypothetical protein